MFITIARRRNAVSPVTSTHTARKTASSTLSWDRTRMPRSMPVTAETVAAKTASRMSRVWAVRPCGMPNRMSRPTLSMTTPMPRVVATPKMVPSTVAMSTASPIGPLMRRPMRG